MTHKTVRVRFHTPKEYVVNVNSIIDSYEGIGIVRTIDPNEGLMVIYSTQGMYKYVLELLESFRKDGIPIEQIFVEESEDVDAW